MPAISDIADVVELHTWSNSQTYSITALKEDLEAALASDELERAEDYARETFEELAARAKRLTSAYPFDFDGTTLTPNSRQLDPSYLFCLGLQFFEEIPSDLRSRHFESIVKVAAEKYFRGNGLRIGAPWSTEQVSTYEELLNTVSDSIPDLGPPIRTDPPGGGDGGWDVVVVNNFADGKFSRVIALGNCATGKTNWRSKGLETQPAFFWSFFTRSPVERNVCVTFIAVPFLMTENDMLRKIGPSCIAFDRIRICEHAPDANSDVMMWLNDNKTSALDIPLV